jgi:hypothetical protein
MFDRVTGGALRLYRGEEEAARQHLSKPLSCLFSKLEFQMSKKRKAAAGK